MIISPHNLVDSLRPLIGQKRSRGFDVEIRTVEELTGLRGGGGSIPRAASLPDAIRNLVLGARPAYLLLVGDHDQTPSYRYNDEYDSDSYFGMGDNDIFPRVLIGRLSSNDPKILNTICRALVEYPADPGTGWKRRVVLTGWCARARRDADPDDAGWRCLEEIGTYYDVLPLFANDRLADAEQRRVWQTAGNTVGTLVEAIGSGAAVVRYLGHGNWDVWGHVGQEGEAFTADHVRQLNVEARLPLIVSAACVTGDIQRDSLAEAFQVQLKAVGVVAADVETETWWMERFVPRVFHEIVTKGTRRVSDIILGAMRQVYDDYPTTGVGPRDSVSSKHSRIFRYLGDPDTILAGPEDDGINACRQVPIPIELLGNGSVRSRPVTIDFGKKVRRAWASLSGIDAEPSVPLLLSRLSTEISIDGTSVTVGASVSLSGHAPLPTHWKGQVRAAVFAVL